VVVCLQEYKFGNVWVVVCLQEYKFGNVWVVVCLQEYKFGNVCVVVCLQEYKFGNEPKKRPKNTPVFLIQPNCFCRFCRFIP
jgi:hypothetical protein